MPIVYKCSGCGQTLAEFRGITGSEAQTPFELYYHLHGKCPNCKRELTTGPKDQDQVTVSGQNS